MSAAVVAPPIPEKSKLRQKSFSSASYREDDAPKSRFVEQFDVIPPPELLDALQETDFHVSTTRKRTKSNAVSKPVLPFLTPSYSSSTLSTSYKIHGNPEQLTASLSAGESSGGNNSPHSKQPTSFWAGPSMKRSASTRSRKGENSGNNVESPRVSPSKGATKINTLFSLNRAEVIITRLEDWQALLKAVIGWLEEVAKIHFQCSRGYSQRTLPLVKRDGDNDEKDAKATIQAGLQMLTLNVAEQHKEFGKRVQLDLLPSLQKLRRDCKEMIKGLKEEPDLLMDELLRLAETTRKAMATLNKHCKAAGSDKSIEHDPMMSNLFVLRHLKREVDEENRMRELMVPIQKGTVAFEKRVIEQLKSALGYCYGFLAPKLWVGISHTHSSSSSAEPEEEEYDDEEEVAPYKLVLKQIIPEYEWSRFYESKRKDLVDEENPKKEYLKINYPNKMNPFVMTVAKGVLERRTGVLKQFAEHYYILSQCGFLHEFALNDKVSPERSIYIPDCAIVAAAMDSRSRRNNSHDDGGRFTFEVHKKGTQVLQRDRVYTFRAGSREELKSWYDTLIQASTRTLPAPPPQQSIPQPQQQEHEREHEREHELEPEPDRKSEPEQQEKEKQRQEPEHQGQEEEEQQQQLVAPSSSVTRSQHSNGSDMSLGGAAASIPSHRSRRSLAGDENSNGNGSTRSSIMTAKPLAGAAEGDSPSGGAEGPKEEKGERQLNDDDDDVQKDIVDEVVKEYIFDNGILDEAPRLETPRTSALFDDSESSIYFSSTSAPPSPSSAMSDDHSIDGIAIPTLEEDEEDMPTTPRAFTVPHGDFYSPMINHRS